MRKPPMGRYVASALAVATALTAVACSESSRPLPPEVEFDFVGEGAPLCDFQLMQRLASRYFDQPELNTVKELIRDMKAAERDGDVALLNQKGFDIIGEHIAPDAPITDGPRRELATDLTVAVIACQDFDSPLAPPVWSEAFEDLLNEALYTGAFEVREPSDGVAPVVTHNCTSFPCADGTWGVEPVDEVSWADVTNDQSVLFYGAVVASTGDGEDPLTETFDWRTVPIFPTGFGEEVRVVRCIQMLTTDPDPFQRVQKGANAFVHILPVSTPSFCPPPVAPEQFNGGSAALESGLLGMLESWTRAAGSLLMPQPLYASAAARGDCCGGPADDFTPFVVVNAGNVNLTTDPDPLFIRDIEVGEEFPTITIFATGDAGTPLPEVKITLTAQVNQGSWVVLGCLEGGEISAEACGTEDYPVYPNDSDGDGDFDSVFAITDDGCNANTACEPEGKVVFEGLTLNKPGGYVLVVTADLLGYPLASITTNAFHVGQ
jgi:hypothetical protein